MVNPCKGKLAVKTIGNNKVGSDQPDPFSSEKIYVTPVSVNSLVSS